MAIINSSQGAISEVIDGLHRKVPSALQKQTKRDRGKIGVKKEVEESDDSSSSSSDSESSDDGTAKPTSSPPNKEGLKTMKKQLKKEETKLKLQKLAARTGRGSSRQTGTRLQATLWSSGYEQGF